MTGLVRDFLKRLLLPPPKEPPAPQPEPAPPPAARERPMTPERAELLRQAMTIYRSKQAVLAELSQEQRQMLITVALKAFFDKLPADSKDKPS